MFYKSMALSPGTKAAVLAVSGTTGSVRHLQSLAPAALVTSHRCSPRGRRSLSPAPCSPPEPAFLLAGMSCSAAVPSHNSCMPF